MQIVSDPDLCQVLSRSEQHEKHMCNSFVYLCKNIFFFYKIFPRIMTTCLCFLLFLNHCRYIVSICNPQSSGLYGGEDLETAFGFPCKIKCYYNKKKVCAMLRHLGLGSLAVNFCAVDLTVVYLSTIKDIVTKDTYILCST